MRLLICAGGTGGGVYPALAVHSALMSERPTVETLWVGGEGGMEEDLVKRQGIVFKTIAAAGLHGVGFSQLPRSLTQLARGVLAARRILREFRPDVLFLTGGYIAAPMTAAGWRVPTLLTVPDIEPGLALKSVARFADRITVTASESAKYFTHREQIVVTGYPVRPDLAAWDAKKAREAFGLSEKLPILLVFGGSKGAHSINMAVLDCLPALLERAQIIHISGQLNWPAVKTAQVGLSPGQMQRYHASPYLYEEMGAALSAADLVVSRAGASTLGEFPLFGLPAVLVPYPYAWRYQKVNADYLAQRGAAVILQDELLSRQFLPTVKALLENPSKREAMRAAMRALAQPRAAQDIAEQLLELGEQRL